MRADPRVTAPALFAAWEVVAIGLASQATGAEWLRAIADLGRKSDDLERPVCPAIIAVRRRRIWRRQACLNEASRGLPEDELAITGVNCGLPDGLALRVYVPGDVAAYKLLKALLPLDRESGAATAGGIIALDTDLFGLPRLAVVVTRGDIALEVRTRQVAPGELLAW